MTSALLLTVVTLSFSQERIQTKPIPENVPADNASVNIQALTGYMDALSIVRPVHLSLFYPIPDPKNVTNLHFASLQVQTSDERMLSVSGSSFPNLSVTLELGERFIVTPQLMEAFAEQGRLAHLPAQWEGLRGQPGAHPDRNRRCA